MNEIEDQIHSLDGAIAKQPPAPATLEAWRLADSRLLHLHAPRLVGCEIEDLGFFDVTVHREVAEHYLSGRHPVLVRVLVPAGTKAILADEDEGALILARGHRFRVIAVDRAGEETPMLVHLELLAR